jgi:hypothetical protein
MPSHRCHRLRHILRHSGQKYHRIDLHYTIRIFHVRDENEKRTWFLDPHNRVDEWIGSLSGGPETNGSILMQWLVGREKQNNGHSNLVVAPIQANSSVALITTPPLVYNKVYVDTLGF